MGWYAIARPLPYGQFLARVGSKPYRHFVSEKHHTGMSQGQYGCMWMSYHGERTYASESVRRPSSTRTDWESPELTYSLAGSEDGNSRTWNGQAWKIWQLIAPWRRGPLPMVQPAQWLIWPWLYYCYLLKFHTGTSFFLLPALHIARRFKDNYLYLLSFRFIGWIKRIWLFIYYISRTRSTHN